MIRAIILTTAIGLSVSACGSQRPAIDPQLDSGVTAANGGGQRATGGVPNVSIGHTPARSAAPSAAGAAY